MLNTMELLHISVDTNLKYWICIGGSVAWPPISPNLTPLDFYFWGHVKTLVYVEKTNSKDPLLRRIFDATKHVREIFDVFGRIIVEISDFKNKVKLAL